MQQIITLSWPERFAMLQQYSPTDEQACAAFGLTQPELDTARTLQSAGTFRIPSSFDATQYGNIFLGVQSSTAPSLIGGTSFARPESANKKVKIAQRRGRKGEKISTALMNIPLTPIPITTFTQQHGISVAVLRQSKRFVQKLAPDIQKQIGTVMVRQDKVTKQLNIWRTMS